MHVLKPMAFKQLEFIRNQWFVSPEAGVPWSEILRPEYWAHVAGKLKTMDEIVVVPEDESFYGRLLVMRSGANVAVVREIQFLSFESTAQEVDEDDYIVKWAGPIARFRVIRKSDGAVLAEGEQVDTKEKALDFIRNHRKALAA